MSLPKIKVLTIDIWGTTLGSSNRRPLKLICSQAAIDFETLNQAMNNDKYQHNENKVEYFEKIFKKIGVNHVLPAEFVITYQRFLERFYELKFKNKNIRRYLRNLHTKGIRIAFLSNTGYLDSSTLQKLLRLDMPVFGSDILGVEKPSLEFYKKSVLNNGNANPLEWLHFGDSIALDIDPVVSLRGNAIHYREPKDWDVLHDLLMKQ